MNVGRPCKALLARRGFVVAVAAVVMLSLGFAWGFVVDDALIVARFSWVVRASGRHAFVLDGPLVDGVTPLPYPWIVAPFACSVVGALLAQRLVGVGAVVAGLTLLAERVARAGNTEGGAGRGAALAGVVLAASSFPLAAHSSSGLETGIATGLVAAALALAVGEGETEGRCSSMLFGLACTFRPELLPAALAAVCVRMTHARAAAHLASVAGPSIVVVIVRATVFGSPLPLSVLAKPSDLRHGLVYVGAALLVTGLYVLPLASVPAFRSSDALRRVRRSAVTLAAVHGVVVACVGGDWMPYARLMVPVVPAITVFVASVRWPVARAGIVLVAVASNLAFGWRHRAEAVIVASTRERVIAELIPVLAGSSRIAGLDVGFLGAAFRGPVVDLAGLTDPEVARLRGGHTSKVLPEGFLDERGVDTLVLWAPSGSRTGLGPSATFGRVVESRLARSPAVARVFTEAQRIRWDSSGAELVIFTRR